MLTVEQVDQYFAAIKAIGNACAKEAALVEKSFAFSGILYLSSSGWLLLSVPNQFVRGAFDALHERGLELPTDERNRLNAHISVMSPEEIETVGGPEEITERGHQFSYSLGPLRTVEPSNWKGVSRVWYITVDSPELRELRRSYGLTPLRKGFDHHITIAIRRTTTKTANVVTATPTGLAVFSPPPPRLFSQPDYQPVHTDPIDVSQKAPVKNQLQKDLEFAPTAQAARENFQARLQALLRGRHGTTSTA